MAQLIELGNRTLMKALIFFIRNPSQKISYTSLRNKIKMAKATLSKNISLLLKDNFITRESVGLNKIYKLNKDSMLVKQLKITDNLFILKDICKPFGKYDVEVYLYGSAARGEDAEESDFDLLVIGKISRENIFKDLKEIGREIKVTAFTQIEWAKMPKSDPAFYERVEKDKIRLC